MAQLMYDSYETTDDETQRYNKELEKTEKKLSNIAKAIASGINFEELESEMVELKQKKTQLQEKILVAAECPKICFRLMN